MPDQRLAPVSGGCNAVEGRHGPQRDHHLRQRAAGQPDLNTGGRVPRRMHAWPRAGRSVKHLTHHDVLSLLGGCWGQTRDADGPTEAELHVY